MNPKDLLAVLALNNTDFVSSKTALLLLKHFGSAEKIFEASKGDLLLALYPILTARCKEIINNLTDKKELAFEKAAQQYEHTEKIGAHIWVHGDENYPELLQCIQDPPLLLFVKGNFQKTTKKLAIVGTRNPSYYGRKAVEMAFEGLEGTNDLVIVSGLAQGVDALAHEKALEKNIPTWAVFGNGLGTIYPAVNKKLAEKILENGGWITEYPFYAAPIQGHFPRRNRIVSGICQAIWVVESKLKGGSMITANEAFEEGREVFATPGSIFESSLEGCNHLLQSQKAHCFLNMQSLFSTMNWDKKNKITPVKTSIPPHLLLEKPLLQLLHQKGKMHFDQILNQLQWSAAELSQEIFLLEMESYIQVLPGDFYICS